MMKIIRQLLCSAFEYSLSHAQLQFRVLRRWQVLVHSN